jgi:predicted aspartyl protease
MVLPTVLMGAGGVWAQGVGAQAAGSPAAKVTCSIDQRRPSEADMALRERHYADAEALYGKALAAEAGSVEAMAGLVRTTLAEDKLPDAMAMATRLDAAHPNTPVLLDALGEVRFRRGEVNEAAKAFNQALNLDVCNGVTHYDIAEFLNLSGMYASAQRRLDLAHTLAPDNLQIGRRWRVTHAVPPTAAERLASLKDRLQNPALTQDEKDAIQAAIQGIESHEKRGCELVSPAAEVKLPIVPISRDDSIAPEALYAAGLDVLFNGKRKRLEIDTGASGLLLSRSAAKSAGLVRELEIKMGGIGDQGAAKAFTTHVDDIRIGSMEIKNCMVQVLEQGSSLGVDGLIGPDMFRNYLVTLDIPGREVRIGHLPKRPGDDAETATSLNTSDREEAPMSIADRARDRYIPPEMKDWTPVYRAGHFLIFPTVIGNAPVKLFMMDTGAARGMITPAAAREVTHVSGGSDMRVTGLNGEVKNVLAADKVSITFAGVRQITDAMTSYDSTLLDHSAGVEISGLIGFPTLRELVISIDYRDNLVHVVYDPKKGYHLH